MIRARLNDPRTWLLALALALVVVALFVPRVDLTRSAYDVVAIIDVTGSMNVRDLTRAGKPVSRLDYIKERLPEFVAELPCQSKFGLGIFSERRVFILFEPVETCENFSSIDASIAELNWRMAWEGDSHVTDGVHDAIANAARLKADLLFLTDGHEAPPLPYTGMPPFEGKPGEVKGLIVGVGGKGLSPIPKFDDAGREIGTYAEGDVLQESRAGLPPPGSENRPGYHPKWAPFGAMPHGEEHLSSVKEGHLRAIAAQTGLSYAYFDWAEALVHEFEAAAKPRQVVVATDIRPYPAGLALALLIVLYGVLPIYDRLRAPSYAFPRLARSRASNFTLKEAQP
jgi:mxaL protein